MCGTIGNAQSRKSTLGTLKLYRSCTRFNASPDPRAGFDFPGPLGEAGGKRRAHIVGLNPGPFFVWPKQRGCTVAGAAFGRHAPPPPVPSVTSGRTPSLQGANKTGAGPGPSQRFASGFNFLNAGSDRGAPRSRSNSAFQALFAFFFRSAHHFRFASLRRFRAAALIRRRRGFSVLRAFLRRCRAAVVPSRAAMAWFRRSRSAFSSVRILSSVKGGSLIASSDSGETSRLRRRSPV